MQPIMTLSEVNLCTQIVLKKKPKEGPRQEVEELLTMLRVMVAFRHLFTEVKCGQM
jgi:hypothetical protein